MYSVNRVSSAVWDDCIESLSCHQPQKDCFPGTCCSIGHWSVLHFLMWIFDLCQARVIGLVTVSFSSSNRILHRHWVSKLETGLWKNWLYWIVLLIISLTSKLTSVSWGGGLVLTLVDPNYLQPSSAAHSDTESLCRAFDHCISEINWPASVCRESFTGKGI